MDGFGISRQEGRVDLKQIYVLNAIVMASLTLVCLLPIPFMEPAEVPGVSGGSWTNSIQETLLLEALELFGEIWNEIAEHVATISKAQCILHFGQMPYFCKVRMILMLVFRKTLVQDEDTSALKETIETAESKNAINTDLSSLKESHETMERNAMIIGPSSLNRSLELTESKRAAEDRPVSPKVDVSDPRDGTKIKG
ncbi:hypothetical protein AQUCO_02700366v1 [Aquilegia coerulea]|uniref:SANT domain-containing protein n=1 Tax=Aquilegia coerulea TaxID=218851 RepID=A0A2G5D6J7_AQUCA|nr:hypothetical protein AQUCO_02700366v1 [Aquilegia coerulea]